MDKREIAGAPQYLLRAKFSLMVFTSAVMLVLVGVFGIILYHYSENSEALKLGYISLALAAISFLFNLIKLKRKNVRCTNTNFVGKYKRLKIDVTLDKVVEVSKSQTLFEKLTRSGSLIVSINFQKYQYSGIRHIDKFIEELNKLRNSYAGEVHNEN